MVACQDTSSFLADTFFILPHAPIHIYDEYNLKYVTRVHVWTSKEVSVYLYFIDIFICRILSSMQGKGLSTSACETLKDNTRWISCIFLCTRAWPYCIFCHMSLTGWSITFLLITWHTNLCNIGNLISLGWKIL